MTSRAPRPIPPDLPVELAVPVLDAIALTALERRLRDAATTVDGIRAGLRRVELREWRGSAADAFRDRLEEWVTTLHRRRDALDEAADLVAEHRRAAADRVELAQDAARRAAHEAARQAAEAGDRPRRAVGGGHRAG